MIHLLCFINKLTQSVCQAASADCANSICCYFQGDTSTSCAIRIIKLPLQQMENDICLPSYCCDYSSVSSAKPSVFPPKHDAGLIPGALLLLSWDSSVWWHESSSSSICARRQTPAGARLRFSGSASYVWPEENTTRLMDFKFQVMGKQAWLSTFWLSIGVVREAITGSRIEKITLP